MNELASFDLSKRFTARRRKEFAQKLIQLSNRIGFKISSRGWGYQLETERLINKDQFDQVEAVINKCRRHGDLPIDFVAEEASRSFSGVEKPTTDEPASFMYSWIEAALECDRYYTPQWWEGEEYYIQMLVEKIDLKTLFSRVCREYHIPIATSKGWSSMLQRATYARRFKEAEEKGLKCVLLYCGDHDPDGLRISDFIRKNLADLKDTVWEDGTEGYDPEDLIIDRFGLSADFINRNNLTWIDNLITGSKKDLASPGHKNHFMPYVQDYIKTHGINKCEANALVPMPGVARAYVQSVIEGYLGEDSQERFEARRADVRKMIAIEQEKYGIRKPLQDALARIKEDMG